MNRRSENFPQGFTLMEILIAMVVFSIIITLLFSSFRAFMLSTERVKVRLEQSEITVQLLQRIQQDLEAVFIVQPPQYKIPEFDAAPDAHRLTGVQETIGSRLVSTIVFSSLAHADVSGSSMPGVARISYYLKKNESDTFDLYRSDFLSPYPEENRSCADAILCKEIYGLEIVYMDEDGDQHKEWDSESEAYDYAFPTRIGFKVAAGRSRSDENTDFFWVELPSGRPGEN